jgi:hypothetical protein
MQRQKIDSHSLLEHGKAQSKTQKSVKTKAFVYVERTIFLP